MANRLRKEIMKDCFNDKIGDDAIRVSLSRRHTGKFTIVIKNEVVKDDGILKCIKSKLNGLDVHDSDDKAFFVIDEP